MRSHALLYTGTGLLARVAAAPPAARKAQAIATIHHLDHADFHKHEEALTAGPVHAGRGPGTRPLTRAGHGGATRTVGASGQPASAGGRSQ
jgi:hypothetical protein